MNPLLAWTMAGAHLALVAFLILGAWWPRLRPAHLVAAVATATVFLLGADCPLTVWENHFRAQAGWDTYGEGFVAHYLWRPSPMLVVAAWLVPTLLAYAVVRGTNRYRHSAGVPSSTST
ncbi:MAG TPA: DUF2784 domain-containing protein [Acidimicrobiia bacterium]|nr:DUF2784 domain-containing protein [Acidimicrobiia bacterium]